MRLKPAASLLLLGSLYAGSHALSGRFPDPASLKLPAMVLSLAGLSLLHITDIRIGRGLLPAFLLWLFLYAGLPFGGAPHPAALALLGNALAFLLAYSGIRLVHPALILPATLLCIGRGVMDSIILTGFASETLEPGTLLAFFGSKHVLGGALVLSIFFHFHTMEKGDPNKPVRALIYTSATLAILTLLMTDSRIAQGALFLCLLPLLVISVRLDGREPMPERLLWVVGMALVCGLAAVNLPEHQLMRITEIFSFPPQFLAWAWTSSWHAFLSHPLVGGGTGAFRFSIIPFETARTLLGDELDLPRLIHAHNHWLEAMVQSGLPATLLESGLAAGALARMARAFLIQGRIESKYAFVALVSLLIMGFFSPALEDAPLSLAYWALIGYGWSRYGEPPASRSIHPAGRMALPILLAALAAFHLWKRVPELKADILFNQASHYEAVNPEIHTNLLVSTLQENPRNEDALYAYASVLARFNRQQQAIQQLDLLQAFAPDPVRKAEALSRIYFSMGRYDSSQYYASRVLGQCPNYLPSLEVLSQSLIRRGLCEASDSLGSALSAREDWYPLPDSRKYTVESMDSLFHSDGDLNLLQHWFGGKTLKKEFVKNLLYSYHCGLQNHSRLNLLREAACSGSPGKAPPKGTPLPGRDKPEKAPPPKKPLRLPFPGVG